MPTNPGRRGRPVPDAHDAGECAAIRPDPASGEAFMRGLMRRLEENRKTKGLFRVRMVSR
jgi:hypothetical protein